MWAGTAFQREALAGLRPELVLAEITPKTRRRGDRDVPVASHGERLGQPAIDGDGVRVPDREQPPALP